MGRSRAGNPAGCLGGVTEPEPPVSRATFSTDRRSNHFVGVNDQDHAYFSEEVNITVQSVISVNGTQLAYVGSGSWAHEFEYGKIITAGYDSYALTILWQGDTSYSTFNVNTITIDGKVFYYKG